MLLITRHKNNDVCDACRTKECVKGSQTAYGCPTFEYPGKMSLNTYCIQCTECLQACPSDNLAVNLRPWGSDLAAEGKPRNDEAYLALIMLALSGFHGLTMTPVWKQLVGGLETALARVSAEHPELMIRGDRVKPLKLVTYAFIPLSVGMFPHIFMHWLTARRARTFRMALVGYPICIAVVWLPSVLLGILGTVDVPGLVGPQANSVLVRMIHAHAPELLAEVDRWDTQNDRGNLTAARFES